MRIIHKRRDILDKNRRCPLYEIQWNMVIHLFGDIMYHIIMNDSGAFVMTSEDGFNPLYEKIGDADNGYSSS